MSLYKLYAGITVTSDDVASLDIALDGIITGVFWSVALQGMDALSDTFRSEVSFMSSSTFGSNDSRGTISMFSAGQNFLTSGGGTPQGNVSIDDLEIPVVAGERIHLHGLVDTGVSGHTTCYIFVKDAAASTAPPRRRR